VAPFFSEGGKVPVSFWYLLSAGLSYLRKCELAGNSILISKIVLAVAVLMLPSGFIILSFIENKVSRKFDEFISFSILPIILLIILLFVILKKNNNPEVKRGRVMGFSFVNISPSHSIFICCFYKDRKSTRLNSSHT